MRFHNALGARSLATLLGLAACGVGVLVACIPSGNSVPSEAGPSTSTAATPVSTFRPSIGVMSIPFEDNFERTSAPAATTPQLILPTPALALGDAAATGDAARGDAARGDAGATGPVLVAPTASIAVAAPDDLGPDWRQAQTNVWHIENGRLCGKNAHNHGVWLQRVLPMNARIEFDAISDSPDGDLKSEVWGDGQSGATGISYTNATSYLTIFGGWHNKYHVLARINEHGADRQEIEIDPKSDDPRERPAVKGQSYHFKVERTDGKTVRWFVDGIEWLKFVDPEPLVGFGHDHFGFNDWEVKVCFDNVKVTPLP
jgi:hypothetical protein